jgi:hypothetical protein
MARVFQGECESDSVKIEGLEVEATILSKGKGESQGLALIDGEKVVYLASSFKDIEDLIDKMGEILDQVVTCLSGIDGATNAPGAQAANIAQVTAKKAELLQLKEVLR